MKLPATSDAAEMVAFARSFLERHSGNPWSDHPNSSAEAGRAFWQHVLWRAARMHPVHRMQVIAMARGGDRDADQVLRTLIIEMQSRGEQLPTELTNFTMEDLHGGLHQPPGPKRKDKVLRDVHIAMAVAAVVDRYGLAPYRSSYRKPASTQLSACAVVAAAQHRLGEKAVESIWRRVGGAMPTVPGWAAS
jgi:hypothetical protein